MALYSSSFIETYLRDYIKASLEADIGPIINCYINNWINNQVGGGLFAIPRLLFPEIDGLGSYITGCPKCTGLNIKTYLSDIVGEIDPNYRKYAGFMALIYRHGLIHQHDPKRFKYKNRQIGWMFQMGNPHTAVNSMRKFHLRFVGNNLMINMSIFYKDIVDSIERFIPIVSSSYKSQFTKSYKEQSKNLFKTSVLNGQANTNRNRRYLYPKDFQFLTELPQRMRIHILIVNE